jgi:Domain of unknown function (DUF4062)
MDKRYQVFISSTYADLQDERQEVIQALLELDCIPAGMELFPAANEDQWTLIKKVIDDCDYYIVILAGRYGSIGPDGLSYTEMEYRYALETGKPVIGFTHKNPSTLQVGKSENTDEGKKKLELFKSLVQKKMCRFWDSPTDLGSQVSRSLVKLIKGTPGIGWVRGNLVPDQAAAEEMLSMRRRIEELEGLLQATRITGPEGTSGLAQGEEDHEIDYTFLAAPLSKKWDHKTYGKSAHLSWDEMFSVISPLLIDEADERQMKKALDSLVLDYESEEICQELPEMLISNVSVSNDIFQTIKVQLRALGLIAKSSKARSVKDTATYWTLTPFGDTVMTRLRAIPKRSTSP